MVYVFQTRKLSIPQVTPHIPPLVGKMMEEPRNLLEYIHQKRAWAHALFFLQQESELYRTFQRAYRVKIMHVLSQSDNLKHQTREMCGQLQQAEAEQDLCIQSLHLDDEQMQKLRGSQDTMLKTWRRNGDTSISRMATLQDKVCQLKSRSDATIIKTTALHADPYLRAREPDILQTLSDAGLKCYDQLRRRPREARSQRTDSIEMVKVVYNCLKQRDILLRDKDFNFHLQQVVDVQNEVEQLLIPLSQCNTDMNRLRLDLRQIQLERQKDIWKLVEGEQPIGPMVAKAQIVAPKSLPIQRSPSQPSPSNTPLTSSEPAGPMSVPNFSNLVADTTTMIQHNMELRYMTQELMNESFQQYRSILSEGQSMNWSHLHGST